jgi:hypothetical protein
MDEFIKLLDKDLEYLHHEIVNDTIYIYVAPTRDEVQFPFGGHMSSRVLRLQKITKKLKGLTPIEY